MRVPIVLLLMAVVLQSSVMGWAAEQTFVCQIEKVVGVDRTGSSSNGPVESRFLLRYTPGSVTGVGPNREIERDRVDAAIIGEEQTPFYNVFLNRGKIDESNAFDTAVSDETYEARDVRGYYSTRLGITHVWISGADADIRDGRLIPNKRLALSIVEHERDGGYISTGYCELAEDPGYVAAPGGASKASLISNGR